jgi:Mn2+/Fe2+ NRAMP family transporter
LLKLILLSQVANGMLLPFVLIFMMLLINKKRIMGEYCNGWTGNAIAGATSVIMIALTAALIWTSVR